MSNRQKHYLYHYALWGVMLLTLPAAAYAIVLTMVSGKH